MSYILMGNQAFCAKEIFTLNLPVPSPHERLRRMHDLLLTAYGPQHWWPANSPFEVVLGAYLTQNTSRRAVERSIENLRVAELISVAGIRSVSLRRLQKLIQPSGFHTRKGSAIKAFVSFLDAEFAGSLDLLAALPTPELRTRLLALPGVGRETADAILLYALHHSLPVVDEYLRRLVDRHDLLPIAPRKTPADYEAMADLTRKAFAADPARDREALYNEFHALVVAVGKAHCSRTPNCLGCPLSPDIKGKKF